LAQANLLKPRMRWTRLPWRNGARAPAVEVAGIDTKSTGAASAHAAELRAAVADALDCSSDNQRFVNESEVVLARLHRAIIHFRQQKYFDERVVFESLGNKECVVHFLIDCVRNRFPLGHKVRQVRADLVAGSPVWDRAFSNHTAHCATCRTVCLDKPLLPQKPATTMQPTEKCPVPFVFELLACSSVAGPVLALSQGCSCALRPWLVALGLLLCVPCVCLLVLKRARHERFLRWLMIGSYATNVQQSPIHWLWRPTRMRFKASPIPRPSPAPKASFMSFGQWGWNASLPVCASISYNASGKSRADIGGMQRALPIAVSCDALHWNAVPAMVGTDGSIYGLPRQATFDGECIVFAPERDGTEPQLWAKLGCRRLDFIYKLLLSLAALGLLMVGVAVVFHPGLTSECGPQSSTLLKTVRTPLRAMLLLDSSGSIDNPTWAQQKDAAESIIQAFAEVYQPETDRVHLGVAQFNSDAQLEGPITNDLASIARIVRSIVKGKGGTQFSEALRMCQSQFDVHSAAGQDSFDVCVLITDGESSEEPANLRGLLASSTEIMGIYVGDEQASRARLRSLTSCGTAASGDCRFFASVADFTALQRSARSLAEQITTGLESEVMETVIAYDCSTPFWTLICLPGIIPFIMWWCYMHLHVTFCARASHKTELAHKEPQRLRSAGSNEAHATSLGQHV